jgi:sugar/nucleoside kinase (ribokinase family)
MAGEQYDFLAVGDIVVDAFIRLKEASVHCKLDHEECEICLRFADKIPYEAAYVVPAVGNSPNAAVAAARLGLKAAVATNVGGDRYGRECIDALEREKVSTEFVAVHRDKKTNYHYVLWYESERTILIKHELYDYRLPALGEPRWMYLSSLGESAGDFEDQLGVYLKDHPSIKLAFQPGTYQMRAGVARMKPFYERAEVFFCNKEEAERILEKPEETDVKVLMRELRALGPKLVVVTDGPAGAYAFDGEKMWQMRSYPDPKPPFERTGAGDAFSSTFTCALALGKSTEDALRWAPVNAMSVVQAVGAQEGLLSQAKLEEFLAQAPEDYYPKPLT